MRILSQDGISFDIQYENCHLVVNKKCCEIEAETNNPNFTPVMASYSSVEKCRKALEMLREEYSGIPHERRIDDLYGRLKYGGREDIRLFVENIIIKGKCFQFPGDDEIEV